MCAISGIVAPGLSIAVLNDAINSMISVQNHRGPDASGIFLDDKLHCAFGHNRLSIIDLSTAATQPMTNADNSNTICFNGEVYNYRELRANLDFSRNFKSTSDTEVILAAYERWGTNSFSMLNGMFAFSILDRKKNEIIIVRDRLGIKPLYYSIKADRFLFSSEIKGILATGLIDNEKNIGSLSEYIYFGSTLGDATLYKNIKQLLPGHYLRIDLATGVLSQPMPYWSVSDLIKTKPLNASYSTMVNTTQKLLESAVQRQLAGDVPIGAFLSGGVDSTAIVALASRHYEQKLRTYTVGFDYIGDGEELPQARKVSQMFGTEHHELHVRGSDISNSIEELSNSFDQPFADPASLPLFQLCKALNGQTKVILQGDGGDELFGGYRRYSYLRLPNLSRSIGGITNKALSILKDTYGKRVFGAHRFFYALSCNEPAERMGLLLSVEGPLNSPLKIFSKEMLHNVKQFDPFKRYREVIPTLGNVDDLQKMLLTDLQILLPDIFLEKVDRATMAVSTEVRVPFLDFELVDYVANLPSHVKVGIGRRKKLLRSALHDIVPPEILNAPKKGFGVPISKWLAGPLRSYAESRILDHSGKDGWFDEAVIRLLFDQHSSGKRDNAQLLWKALQLAIWLDRDVIANNAK